MQSMYNHLNESSLLVMGLTQSDISTFLQHGMITDNKSYVTIDDITNEAKLYENFINSIKPYLQNRYEDTLSDLSIKLRNAKDAGVMIKEIINDPKMLELTMVHLIRQLRAMVKTINITLNELKKLAKNQQNSIKISQFQKFYNLVNALVQKCINIKGWKGFLLSLSTHTLLKYSLIQFNNIKEITGKLNFLSSDPGKKLTSKFEDISKLSMNISTMTLFNYLGLFTELIGLLNLLLDTLSNIKKKILVSYNPKLQQKNITENSIINNYKYWKSISENSLSKSDISAEKLLLSAIISLHKMIKQYPDKSKNSLAFEITRYFNLPINARELVEKYNFMLSNEILSCHELIKIGSHWVLVSKLNPSRIIKIYPIKDEKPSDEWILHQVHHENKNIPSITINEFKSIKKEYLNSQPLSEIHEIPISSNVKTEWLKDYNHWNTVIKTTNAKHMGKFMTYDLYWIRLPYKIEIVALDHVAEDTAVMMSIRKLNSDFYQVDKVATANNYASKGLAVKLYKKIINDGIKLMSDTEQSIGGKRIWLELAKSPDITIYGLDYNHSPPIYTNVRVEKDQLIGDYNLYTQQIINNLKNKKEKIKDEIAITKSDIVSEIDKNSNKHIISKLYKKLDNLEQELDKLEYYNPEESRDYMRKIRLVAINNSSVSSNISSKSNIDEVVLLDPYPKDHNDTLISYDQFMNKIKQKRMTLLGNMSNIKVYMECPNQHNKIIYLIDNNKVIGTLLLSRKVFSQWEPDHCLVTDKIEISTEYKGNNLPAKLYKFLLHKLKVPLMSGSRQSKGGIHIWKQLHKMPGVFVYGVDITEPNLPRFTQFDLDDEDFMYGEFDIYDHMSQQIKDNRIKDIENMITLINRDIADEEISDNPNIHKIENLNKKINVLTTKIQKIRYSNSNTYWLELRLMATLNKRIKND